MELLERKIDAFLSEWKNSDDRMPLIVKGARQIGKTESIRHFGRMNYGSVVEINFALQSEYRDIFDEGFDVDSIIRNISIRNPSLSFTPGDTLIFFDEIQACPNAATSLKPFKQDGRFDVICSGSLMGISYREIESNSVGYKQDYLMYPMDFEEFLWAKGYHREQIDYLYQSMLYVLPLSSSALGAMQNAFREYMVVGGMPHVVSRYVTQNNFSGLLEMQRQLVLDYEEDITKYAAGLDKAKVLNFYRKIPLFLGKDNKKFQITKISRGARNREYIGVKDWLSDAGIVQVCYAMDYPELPLRGNYNPDDYRIFYCDVGLLVGALDDEVQDDLRINKNFGTYKGGLYENAIANALTAQGYPLCFYRDARSQLKMEFFVRDADSLVPVEVKSTDGATASLTNLINKEKFSDIRYGIKFADKNIGFNGNFYTFPHCLAFLLKRFLRDRENNNQ